MHFVVHFTGREKIRLQRRFETEYTKYPIHMPRSEISGIGFLLLLVRSMLVSAYHPPSPVLTCPSLFITNNQPEHIR